MKSPSSYPYCVCSNPNVVYEYKDMERGKKTQYRFICHYCCRKTDYYYDPDVAMIQWNALIIKGQKELIESLKNKLPKMHIISTPHSDASGVFWQQWANNSLNKMRMEDQMEKSRLALEKEMYKKEMLCKKRFELNDLMIEVPYLNDNMMIADKEYTKAATALANNIKAANKLTDEINELEKQ